MSDLIISPKNNFIELDTIQSTLYPDKEGIGFWKRLNFLFSGKLKGKINSIFIRLNNKELHFLKSRVK
jgi:hypothetical protein